MQIGGPSGGCIPEQHLDIDIDYESLKTVGAMMGSGGLVVMDEDTCMVDVAKFFMDFIQRESCGKCIPCREGTRRMLEILQRITRGRRREKGIDALERFKSVLHLQGLAETIRDTSLCGLGQTAPNPVLSTLRWFRDEYEAHIYERRCPAGACTELVTYQIDPDKCKGCTLCAKKCPAERDHRRRKAPHHIIVRQVHRLRQLHGRLPSFGARSAKSLKSQYQDEPSMITIEVNGRTIQAEKGEMLLPRCAAAGIKRADALPPRRPPATGACRMCVVEVEGQRGLVPSCAFPAADGMKVQTHSPRAVQAPQDDHRAAPGQSSRRLPLLRPQRQLRAPGAWPTSWASATAASPARRSGITLDTSSPSIVRDPAKCILCGKCVRVCEEIQGVAAIDFIGRGCRPKIGTAFDEGLNVSTCVNCGQCITVCPTGALSEQSHIKEVLDALNDPDKIVVVQHAPAVSVTLGEEFGLPPGTDVAGAMTAALRRLGFDRVFDTGFAADLTIMEEGSELVHRLQQRRPLPMLTSCSPGWIKFVETCYPEFIGESLDLQEPAADDGRGHQELLRPARGDRSGEDLQRERHALHGEEVRGRPAGDGAATGWPTSTPC